MAIENIGSIIVGAAGAVRAAKAQGLSPAELMRQVLGGSVAETHAQIIGQRASKSAAQTAERARRLILQAAPELPPREGAEIKSSIISVWKGSVLNPKEEVLGLSSVKIAVEQMLTDPRFSSVQEANSAQVKNMLAKIHGLNASEMAAEMDVFATMFEGVNSAPEMFAIFQNTARKMIERANPTIADPYGGLARFQDARISVPGLTLGSRSGGNLTLGLSADQEGRLKQWIEDLTRTGQVDSFDFSDSERSGIRSFDISVGGQQRRLTFAQFRTKAGESFNVPLDDLENYKFGDLGYLYIRDKAGQTLYSPPGRVGLTNSAGQEVMSGMEYLFGKGRGLLDILEKSGTSGRGLMDQITKFGGDVADEPYQVLQLIPQEQGMTLNMAMQYAQMKIIDENKIPTSPEETFKLFQALANQDNYEIFPIGSPGSIEGNNFFWTQATKYQYGEHPAGTNLVLGNVDQEGNLATASSITRRPARLFSHPLPIINPGSNRALADIPITGLHMFAGNAPLQEMVQNQEFSGFVQGTFYLKDKATVGKSNVTVAERFFPGEGLVLDLSGSGHPGTGIRGGMTVLSPTSAFEIRAGRLKPGAVSKTAGPDDYELFRYNPKLQSAMDALEQENVLAASQGRTISIEERREIIKRSLSTVDQTTNQLIYDVTFDEGEFIGTNVEEGGLRHQFVGTAGHSPGNQSILIDLIPSEQGYTAVFGKETPVREGAKVEGTAVGTISEPVISVPRLDGVTINPEYIEQKRKVLAELEGTPESEVGTVRSGGLSDLFGKIAGNAPESDLIETADESRMLVREGNIRALRTQQQGAVAMVAKQLKGGRETLQDIIDEINGVKIDPAAMEEFHRFMRSKLGEHYAEEDTNMLAKLLTYSNDLLNKKSAVHGRKLADEEKSTIFGLIFGLEDKNLKALDDRSIGLAAILDDQGAYALEALGLNRNVQGTLTRGIEESKGVVGFALRIVRGVPSQEGSRPSKFERRNLEQVFQMLSDESTAEERKFASHILYNVAKRSEKGDSLHLEALAMAINQNTPDAFETAKKTKGNILDLDALDFNRDNKLILKRIREQGGYLVKDNKSFYIPGEELLARLTVKDSRAGRYTEDLEIRKAVSGLLNTVESINMSSFDDYNNESSQTLLSTVSRQGESLNEVIFAAQNAAKTAVLEGRVGGAISGQVGATARASFLRKFDMGNVFSRGQNLSDDVVKKLKGAKGYTVGMSRQVIEEHFAQLKKGKGAEETEYLNKMLKRILSGHDTYAVAGWQHPQISGEASQVFLGYYDKSLDELGKGAFRIGDFTEESTVGRIFKKIAGLITGKLSADNDGDTATMMVIDAISDPNANWEVREKQWAKVRDLTSQAFIDKQFDRQQEYFKKAKGYHDEIKKSVNRLSSHSASGQNLFAKLRAYIKGTGQGNVGRISNKLKELHSLNVLLKDSGAINYGEYKEFMSFIQGFEQFAVGFKHASVSIVDLIENKIGSALGEDAQDTGEGLKRLREFLVDFGMNEDLAKKVTGHNTNIEAAQHALELFRTQAASRAVAQKSEKVTAAEVIRAGSEAVPTLDVALDAARQTMASSNKTAAATAAGQTNKETQVMIDQVTAPEADRGLSEANAIIKKAAAGVTNAGMERQTAESRALQAAARTAREARSASNSKYGRMLMIGGGLAAGAYALFNKGYDDEPLSDIPPPPPGQERMHATQADLEGVRNGRLLDDHLTRQQLQMAEASSGYGQDQMYTPNGVPIKSYLSSATARINNRSLIVDKTNPIEYARAIKQIMPGSQVNLQINNRYSVPSDLERQL